MSLLPPPDEGTEEIREAFPSHFLLKIESFSLLLNANEKYESMEFTAGGYKWRLIIDPNGIKTENGGGDYISVNLAVADPSSLPANWEINAVFSIFLYNQILDNYLSIRGRVRRFHVMKPEWGFSKFISKTTLNDPSNGYVINDNCVFGAEVFVARREQVIERVYMLKDTKPYLHKLKIANFSKLEKAWYSEEFVAGGHKWKIVLYPKGNGQEEGHSASIFLSSVDCKCITHRTVKADYSVCIKSQVNSKDHKRTTSKWFSFSSTIWGWPGFIPLADLNDPTKGFIVNDCCILKIEISVKANSCYVL